MNRISRVLFPLLLIATMALVGCTTIPAGHVGVIVNNIGKARGVQDIPAITGLQWYNPLTEDVFKWPTSMQNAVWTASKAEGHPIDESITFTNKDNMVISVDVSIGYTLQPEGVPAFYVKFRTDNMDTFTHGFLRNITRDAFNEVASQYPVERIMGDNAEFIGKVRAKIQSDVDPYKVKLEQFGIIGAPRPPQSITASINAKMAAVQLGIQKQNEVVQATADAQKTVATAKGAADAAIETARGEAESNRIKMQSLTPAILEWRKLDIQAASIEKWDGAQPQIITSGNSLLQLPALGK